VVLQGRRGHHRPAGGRPPLAAVRARRRRGARGRGPLRRRCEGNPHRLGFALGNEFSDHVTERQNYLWLAHSKLRPSSFGPELRTGPLPESVEGTSRIRRGGEVVWEKPFASGEANMSHTLANLEHHHFKYALFRRPGSAHVHYFGTATLSFADGVRVEPGDTFEIECPAFGRPLRNRLALEGGDRGGADPRAADLGRRRRP
jgi:hypothetical protein